MRQRLAEAAATLLIVGLAVMALPGLALVFAYVALILGSLRFLLAGLHPASLSARSLATAVFLAGALVWPLAKPMDVDTPQTGISLHSRADDAIRSVHQRIAAMPTASRAGGRVDPADFSSMK